MKAEIRPKEEKGITLIALVITVIVLLILAGVIIVTLTGDNGILNQAGNAKEEIIKSNALEAIQVEVLESYKESGEIDFDKLNSNLSKIGINVNIQSLPSEKISKDGYDFMIDETQNVVDYKETFLTLFDKDELKENGLHIGDFVNYNAGIWTEEEITKANGRNSKSLSIGDRKFGGYIEGDSRNKNATPFLEEYKASSEGWRVWDIDENRHEVTLISAGCPEDFYYYQDSIVHAGSVSAYILTGIPDSYLTDDEKVVYQTKIRDYSMYLNKEQYAISATALTKKEIDLWYNKYMNIENADIWQSNTFRKVYGTKYESLIDNYTHYWLATTYEYAYPGAYLYYFSAAGSGGLWRNGGLSLGIRILITLPANVEIEKSTETKTVSTREKEDFSYNVWNIK